MDYPAQVIDVHCHMFNARHIPLFGVLKSKGVPAWLARPIAWLLWEITDAGEPLEARGQNTIPSLRDAENAESIGDHLGELASAKLATRLSARAPGLDSVSPQQAHLDRYHQELLADDRLYQALIELEELRDVLDPASPADLVRAATGLERTSDLLRNLSAKTDANLLADSIGVRFIPVIRWAMKRLEQHLDADEYGKPLDYVRFFALMTSSEDDISLTLIHDYGDVPKLTLVHLLMDMQYGYEKGKSEPYYPYSEQVVRMERVGEHRRTEGHRVCGMVAFDPRRPDGLEIVKCALTHGYIGVKVYPPMGYPAGGTTTEEKSRFDNLYAYCQTNSVPIMTHCTPVGMEAYKGAGVLASPTYWADVLCRFPTLKVCFGHAGGGGAENLENPNETTKVFYPGWFCSDADWEGSGRNFARKVVELCIERTNVYCDLSYLTEIIGSDETTSVDVLRKRLAALLKRSNLGDRIMYGSDWHMPEMARNARRYFETMNAIFSPGSELAKFRDKFFFQNALGYLKSSRELAVCLGE